MISKVYPDHATEAALSDALLDLHGQLLPVRPGHLLVYPDGGQVV
eukprot:CAMPEP_0179326840 /NCGR_PEP_ID=MMETSP0797-20121207/61638_1 /TAXON_ID=47934 /ORGANISM="Dinophysis acuminata, Strain DAEP01" /LENGTH=44 /DNA_ID= /DNA_START= /DNA_END= /DNA_ORIENTATION=